MTHVLRTWFRDHRRPLPWRVDRDPYRVWVAEVLLQQTRVTQATPYFERFVRAFPTVERLARAPEGHVLKVWQGAGYYARARHLHDAARRIVRERAGRFPTTVDGWEELPGVGPYIARAVASLVDETPVVALEANGLRVAARWIREEGDLRTPVVRDRLERVLANLLPRDAPGEFNEAVMELGETICRPVAPSCPDCPVRFACRARRELADPGSIPVRSPTARRPHVRAAIAVVGWNDRRLVQRRPAGGLLGGLWEFPGGKIEPGERPIEAAAREFAEETGLRTPALAPVGVVHHVYSHFSVTLHVFRGSFRGPRPPAVSGPRRWVTSAELGRLPLPKATEKILERLDPAGTASRGSGSRPGRTPSGPRGGAAPPPVRAPPPGRSASRIRRRAPR
ncbi:MAG: A/G-specific adenine glycosylase [Thermoplasmata archaeon]